MFCGSDGAEDSIEHYAVCPRIAAVAGPALALPRVLGQGPALADFLTLDTPAVNADMDLIVRQAIRLAAVYKVHVLATHGALLPGPAAAEALTQTLREAVRGHRRASGIYDRAQAAFWA